MRLAAGIQTRLNLALALSVAFAARGAIYPFADNGGGNYSAGASGLGQVLPDNNPSGVAFALDFGAAGQTVGNLSVTFSISAGYNGDLYAYLAHGSSTLILLNRAGVANGTSGSTLFNYGYSGSGFNNITLNDSGAGNIHNYGGGTLNSVPTTGGAYKPDGQTTSPLTAPVGYSAGGGSATFASTFGGTDPSGSWTLFFADMSGGSTATLNSWSVDIISAVPEPANLALGVFGALFLSASVLRAHYRRRVRRRGGTARPVAARTS